ncbi:MAG: hypothetical protein ABSD56_14285, partial [Bryobacteraceae bacterium]
LWLSGPAEVRLSTGTFVLNFVLSSKKPAFQVYGSAAANAKHFVYEDTLRLTAVGTYPLDSLTSTESNTAACNPPRPFALYGDQSSFTALVSMHDGSAAVTTYSQAGFRTISGRVKTQVRGIVGGVATSVDTLQAIYTFSAPLRDTTGVCP